MKKTILAILCFFLFIYSSKAQKIDIGIGINLRYHIGFKEGSSNFSGSLAVGLSKQLVHGKNDNSLFIPTYQLAVNMYNTGLGTSMLKAFKRTELDIVNTFSATLVDLDKDEEREIPKPRLFRFKAFNPMTASAFVYDYGEKSVTLSTSFIGNNHRRNQHIGYVGFNIGEFRMGYYNDAVPFPAIMADLYDRWWTGGVFFQYGSDVVNGTADNDLQFILNFDRFTGDVQDAYKFATRLALNYVPTKDIAENLYNRGQTSFSVRHKSGWSGSVNALGHFPWDLQKITHKIMGLSRHVSFAQNYFTYGIEYNQPLFFNNLNLPK